MSKDSIKFALEEEYKDLIGLPWPCLLYTSDAADE